MDALELLKMRWDMIIAFPPCTYLTRAAAIRLHAGGVLDEARMDKARAAKEFFMAFYRADCPRAAVENPVPERIHGLPKCSQIIEPYYFGDPWRKQTCLWLRGLPPLMATDLVVPKGLWVGSTSARTKPGIVGRYELRSKRDPKERAKTFPGIAKAMATQWAGRIKEITGGGADGKP